MRLSNYNKEILKTLVDVSNPNLLDKFPKVDSWITGEIKPTTKQLAKLSKFISIPFGYFFLDKLPDLKTGIPLFRSNEKNPSQNYSQELSDTIRIIQFRQNWLKEYLIEQEEKELEFVGSAKVNEPSKEIALDIKKTLGISENWASSFSNWNIAFKYLIEKAEQTGIYITLNGVVGNNTRRTLDSKEFRGFVLIDKYAPFIFLNSNDFLGAKMFTLTHELAHIWLGKSAAFDLSGMMPSSDKIELKCNEIAAEFLVPTDELKKVEFYSSNAKEEIEIISKKFKVSSIVAARRLLDNKIITKDEFFDFYNYRKENWLKEKEGITPGGHFYNTQNTRIGTKFFNQILTAVKSGKLLYTDAYRLTGLYGKSFENYINN